MINQNTCDKVRLGLILEASQVADLKAIEKPLTALLEKYKDKIELVIYGWSLKMGEQYGFFKGFPVHHAKPEMFTNYHLTLNNLCIDIGLIPFVPNVYNTTGKVVNRYFDFASCIIPVIAADQIPFKKLIKEGENGFLAETDEDWGSKIEKLITEPKLRKNVGRSGFNFGWQQHSYNSKSIQRLKNIFI